MLMFNLRSFSLRLYLLFEVGSCTPRSGRVRRISVDELSRKFDRMRIYIDVDSSRIGTMRATYAQVRSLPLWMHVRMYG
jgi:hypothetical protein